jgi:hypothetical protein
MQAWRMWPAHLRDRGLCLLLKSEDFWWGVAAMAFVVATLPSYTALSLSSDLISDDARQWAWPFWTFVDPERYPPDFFSEYMMAQTPPGFAWLVRVFIMVGCTPDVIFKAFGVIAFLTCSSLAFLTGRRIGGASVGWAALLLAFSIGGIATTTAGGFPRAAGLAVLSLAVFGFVTGRSWATAVASILGALVWYPAAVISGPLYALQMLAPKPVFGGVVTKSLQVRIAIVALVGGLTLLPIVHALANSHYGELIAASDPAWPEAGPGGRFSNDGMLGSVDPLGTAFQAAMTLFNNPEGAWLGWRPFRRDVACVVSLSALIVTWLILGCLSASDPSARRLLTVFFVGAVLFVLAIFAAPYMYVPSRYVVYLWLPTAVVATPYAAYRCRDALQTFATWLPSKNQSLVIAILGLILFGAGRLTTQGLYIQPDEAETRLLNFATQTAPGAVFAGWPTGAIDDVPYFSHRPVLLAFELHMPFYSKVARETRARAYSLIDAWFSRGPSGILTLHNHYGVRYLIIDKYLLEAPTYFKPFDERIRLARGLLNGAKPYVAHPDQEIIVFEDSEYMVLSLPKLADMLKNEP